MFLSKDPNGNWYVYYTGADGKTKRTSTRCRNKSAAYKFLQSFNSEEKQEEKKEKVVLLKSFIDEFVSSAVGNYSEPTIEKYRYCLELLLLITGNIPLTKITPRHYDSYKSSRLTTTLRFDKTKNLSPNTVNIELRTLRAALFTALRWDYIKTNPFSKQKLARVPESSPIFFSKADIQKLLLMIKEEWLKEAIIFAALTGLRLGEMVNLQWRHVDLQRKVITIQSSPNFKTKNGKKRNVPLNDTSLYILKSKADKNNCEYVFSLNDRRIYGDWLSHKFKEYVRKCNFQEKRLHFHSLRHTFASWLVQDGVSIYAVKELLGHSDVKVTEVYSHLQPEQLHETVNRLNLHIN